VILEFRGLKDGFLEPWETLYTSPIIDADTYEPIEYVGHIQGNYEAAQAIVTIERLDTSFVRSYGAQIDADTTQNNLRAASLVMNAVVK